MNKIVRQLILLCGFMVICLSHTSDAAEYFVGKHGQDNNSGSSQKSPLRTLKQAFSKMQPGDTLTILPGEYHQSSEWKFSGGDKPTTIKAAIPGTVVLRGDKDAPAFSPTPGSQRIWQCKQAAVPQAVNERDTLNIYLRMPSVTEMEFHPGSWFYDNKTSLLHVHTSDSAPPDEHYLTISAIRGHGVLIVGNGEVNNVIIDGLIVTGFNANSPSGIPGNQTKWGVYLSRPKNCAVRNTVVFLNGSGIGFSSNSKGSRIESCQAYANSSPSFTSGGNIIVMTPAENDAIRNCTAFASKSAGIRYYGSTPAKNSVFEDNIAFGNVVGDLWIKYPSDTTVARRCISESQLHSRLAENCIFSYGVKSYSGTSKSCIIRPEEKKYDPYYEFADHINFDYHLQADSMFRGSSKAEDYRGPAPFSKKIYFVDSKGSNRNNGNSIRSAWQSLDYAVKKLTNGGTLYLTGGVYNQSIELKNLKNIAIKGRGNALAVINGTITLTNCHNISLERISLVNRTAALNISNSSNINLNNLGVNGPVNIKDVKAANIKNNAFYNSKISSDNSDVIFYGNIMSGTSELLAEKKDILADFNSYSGTVPDNEHNSIKANAQFTDPANGKFTLKNSSKFNGRDQNSMPIGPYRMQPYSKPLEIVGPKLESFSTTTGNIEIWSNLPVSGALYYGQDKKCANKINFPVESIFHTISLTGLQPGRTYYYKIKVNAKVAEQFSNQELSPDSNKYLRQINSETSSFHTSAKEAPAQTYHVSTQGNNANSGLSLAAAWKTISHAAIQAVAGDTVIIHQGKYYETVRVRATGDVNRTLTFQSAPGEKVWIDGNNLQLDCGFLIENKDYIKIDGIYLKEFRCPLNVARAAIIMNNANNINLTRCFYDGRSDGYTPGFIWADNCRDINIDNCFMTRGFSGMTFNNCPNLVIRNSVIYINQVTSCKIYNKANEKVTIANNIWVDNTLQKTGNALIQLHDGASLIERNNCYLTRVDKDLKTILGYSYYQEEKLPRNFKGQVLDRQWQLQGRFHNEMATYSDFLRRSGAKSTSVFIDPKMNALNHFIRFSSLEEWEKTYRKFMSDHYKYEYHKVDGKFEPFDFADFFANNPVCKKLNIGLEQKLFKDFK
ncbi:MAG: right-handed parallel beta-helix repeat-containing protein [Victivallaceae bacterium]